MFDPTFDHVHPQSQQRKGLSVPKNMAENTIESGYVAVAAGDTFSSSGPSRPITSLPCQVIKTEALPPRFDHLTARPLDMGGLFSCHHGQSRGIFQELLQLPVAPLARRSK